MKLAKIISAIFDAICVAIAFPYHIYRRSVKYDRMLAKGEGKTIMYILILVLSLPIAVACVLILFGADGRQFLDDCNGKDAPNLFWTMLYHCIDPGNQHMAVVGWRRAVVFTLGIFGCIFLNGVLISSIVGWYDRFIDKWEKGLARYDRELKKSCFIVIIGNNEALPSLIRQIFARKESVDYVLVQTNTDVEFFRKQLLSYLTPQEEERVIIYAGEQDSEEDIADLHLECAQEVFILGDSVEDESYKTSHDALNMKCLQIISKLLLKCSDYKPSKGNELICHVMFEYQTSFSIFQFADISNNIANLVDFRPFNYYEQWAQRVFVNRALNFPEEQTKDFLPLEGKTPIDFESKDFVHLVVVGMSKMGVAMAIEAAHLAHYPNFVRDQELKTRITFIDTKCEQEMKFFKGRFKELFKLSRWRSCNIAGEKDLYNSESWEWENKDLFEADEYKYLGKDCIDVEWEFIEGGIESEEVHSYLAAAATNKNARFTLAVCLPQGNHSVAASLYLPEEVYENAVQVLVYQRQSDAIINSIAGDNKSNLYYQRLKAFGMLDQMYDDALIETSWQIAKILGDEYYVMYKKVNADHNKEETDRTNTRKKSNAASRWSNVYNANTLWGKLRSINAKTYEEASEMIGAENSDVIDNLARTEHNRWVIEQLLMRFRALTKEEQEGVVAKTMDKEALKGDKMAHLNICSFDKLREVDDVACEYDEGFIKIIPTILNRLEIKTQCPTKKS